MSRTSNEIYNNGRLWNGFDYARQAWVIDGRYVSCGHPDEVSCNCFGRLNEGLSSQATFESDLKAFGNGAPSAPFYGSAQPSMPVRTLNKSEVRS